MRRETLALPSEYAARASFGCRSASGAAGHERTMDHWGILEEDEQMCVYVEAVENGFFDLVRMLSEVEVLRLCFVDRSLVFQWH